MSRVKPYTKNKESWITKFLDNIFKIYEEDKYVEKWVQS